MCINPTITYKKCRDGSFRRVEFGCGKCSECVSKKHSAFALEASLEARRAKSLHMVTLTYNNGSVPIMCVRRITREGVTHSDDSYFIDKGTRYHSVASRFLECKMDGSKALDCRSLVLSTERVDDSNYFELLATPSLRREDVRLWIKKCRVMYKRSYGVDMPGRYAFFGEYGDQTNRPHYHGLLYDFPDNAIQLLKTEWEKSFGFTLFEVVPSLNPDGSPARVKVANYVSKYIAKDHKYRAVEDKLVEAPRRFCSRGFGTKCLTAQEINSFKNFINAKI